MCISTLVCEIQANPVRHALNDRYHPRKHSEIKGTRTILGKLSMKLLIGPVSISSSGFAPGYRTSQALLSKITILSSSQFYFVNNFTYTLNVEEENWKFLLHMSQETCSTLAMMKSFKIIL
jgi:hypothetical protein